ncbi:MAG: DUF1592 domain-containing protein [Aureliella sp.]
MAGLLRDYCVDCHGASDAESGFRVDTLTEDFTNQANLASWIEIRDRLNLGEMPPPDAPQPQIDNLENASRWIASKIRSQHRRASAPTSGRLMRRLNRYEYSNTIADLLSMKFPTGESPLAILPPDGTSDGFDKVSTALLLDPSLMSSYYQVARRVADRAIVDGPPQYPTETMRLEFEDIPASGAIGYLVNKLGLNPVAGGLEMLDGKTRSFGMLNYPGVKGNNVAPVNGFYRFTIRAGGARGADGELPRIAITQGHPDESMRKVMEVEVTAPWDSPEEYSIVVPRDTLGGEVQVEMLNGTSLYMGQRPGENFMARINEVGKKGDFTQSLRLTGRKVAEGWGGDRATPDPEKLDRSQYARVKLDYLEVEGPLYDQWPPKSHTSLFYRDRTPDESDIEYAEAVLLEFLPKAWRRPVLRDEAAPILRVVQTELDNGTPFVEAMRVAVAATLTSPSFLYITDPTPAAPDSDKSKPARPEPAELTVDSSTRALRGYAIASRLSYMLYNSMPDEQLIAAAAAGKLIRRADIATQVDRMLADDKAERFIEDFGRQWLRTETFLAFEPAPYLYKEYDEELSEAIVREPIEFLREIVHADQSMLNFIDSEFLVINERLAEHYGIKGVEGERFRKVPVPSDSPRGGLLAMAGVHQAGSDGIRTKPVSRAVYIREVLFHDPPDPPPPSAGEVEPNIEGEHLTVRERLIQHQKIEACAACHRSLDPYGFALENFNVVGSWREQQDGEKFRRRNRPPIDPSGQLPSGQSFETFAEFRELLANQKDRFRRSLAKKLFLYAIGRPALPSDDATIETAARDMASSGDTLRSLIKSIATSEVFSKQ